MALFIVSNFLSNPAKTYLETYKRNNNPPFGIKVWERTNLESMSRGKTLLLRMHGVLKSYFRPEDEIGDAAEEFFNRVWYYRKLVMFENIREGKEKITSEMRKSSHAGSRQQRKQILGTLKDLPSQADAFRVVETFSLSIHRNAVEHAGPPPTLRRLIEHYRLMELPMDNHEGKRRSTKMGYISNLENHIVPRWGDSHPGRVTAVEVEEWLKALSLAPASRAKVRNVLSAIFRHGMRWGCLDKNPIATVRVISRRLQDRTCRQRRSFALCSQHCPSGNGCWERSVQPPACGSARRSV